MTSYTWTDHTGDWGTASLWFPTNGPPGLVTLDTDVANIVAATAAVVVTVAPNETFDVATLGVAGGSTADKANLIIGGTIRTDTLSLTGPGGDAVVNVIPGGLLDIRTALTADNPETIAVSGVLSGGTLEFGNYQIASANVTVSFLNGIFGALNHGHVQFDTYGGDTTTTTQTIKNWATGDSVTFVGADFTGDTYSYSASAHTLTVFQGHTATTVLTMNNVYTTIGTTGFVFNGDQITVVCFAGGTRIRSASGEQAIETLRPGDQVVVVTAAGEALRPVQWIGRRRIDLNAHPHPDRVAPVRILRGAFAEGVPSRDLLVSPDHAIYADGKLMCARQLVNGTTVRQEAGLASIEYFHVDLGTHEILLAEGLPAESYLDTGNRGFFANTDMPHVLHPDLTSEADYPAREVGSCAPFVWQEEEVRPVWEKLAARAAELGQPVQVPETTGDADFAIIANGRTLRPLSVRNGRYQFMVPAGATELQLVSRAASPADTKPWMEDRRRLGVYVEQIRLRDRNDVKDVPLDHPSLMQGWWAVERSGSELRRWTSGTAVLPLPRLSGPTVLEIAAGSSGLAYLSEVEAHGIAA